MTGNTNDNLRWRQSSDLGAPCGAPLLRLDSCGAILIAMVAITDVSTLPLAPKNPLPLRQLVKLVRSLNTGQELIRDAGGPVTRIKFGPKWLVPPIVAVTSPDGIRDVLGRTDASSERCIIHEEVRNMAGDSLFVLPQRVRGCRASAHCNRSSPNTTSEISAATCRGPRRLSSLIGVTAVIVDLDVECRRLTMRSLGRSVLGIDLNERADVDRRPHACRVLLHRRSRAAARACTAMATDPGPPPRPCRGHLDAQGDRRDAAGVPCRSDLDAPLVHALIAATDPETGQPLSDDDICNDLLIFMLAGHDTTATALTYALWALGHHREIQDRVAAEAAEIGDRELTPEDVPRLGYTVQVLREALRIAAARRGGSATCGARHRRSMDTALRRAASWPWESMPCIGIPPCGTGRWSSIPTGSARKPPKARTVGNSFRSSRTALVHR